MLSTLRGLTLNEHRISFDINVILLKDKSRINNHTVKQAEETLRQETSTSQSTVTKTSVSQTSADQSTSVKPGGVSMTTTLTQTVSTKTSAKPTSTPTSTSTTGAITTGKSQASSLSTGNSKGPTLAPRSQHYRTGGYCGAASLENKWPKHDHRNTNLKVNRTINNFHFIYSLQCKFRSCFRDP